VVPGCYNHLHLRRTNLTSGAVEETPIHITDKKYRPHSAPLSVTDLKYDGDCSTSTARAALAGVLPIALHATPAALIKKTLI